MRPLSPCEEFYARIEKARGIKFAVVLELERQLTTDELNRRLATLQRAQPMLRVRIEEVGTAETLRFVSTDDAIPLACTAEEPVERIVEREFATPFSKTGPLVRCTAATASGKTTLVFVFHHAGADARSAVAVLMDAFGPNPTTKPLDFFPASLEEQLARRRVGLSSKLASLRAAAKTLVMSRFGGFSYETPRMGKRPPRTVVAVHRLASPEVDALLEASRDRSVTVHCALGAGMLLECSPAIRARYPAGTGDKFTLISPTDMQPWIRTSNEPMLLMSVLPLTSTHRVAGLPFWALATDISAQVRALRDDAAFAAGAIKMTAGVARVLRREPREGALVRRRHHVLLTNIGKIAPQPGVEHVHFFLQSAWFGGGVIAAASTYNGTLSLNLTAESDSFERNDLEALRDRLVGRLTTAVRK